jgi:signal transduction histidine kinase
MRVATKLSGAFVLYIAVLVALLAYHVRTLRNAVETSYELSEISQRLYVNSTEQLERVAQLQENADKYWVTRDAGYLDRFEQLFREFDAALVHLESVELGPRENEEVKRLAEQWAAFTPVAQTLGSIPLGLPEAAAQDSLARLRGHLEALYQQAQNVSAASRGIMLDRLGRSARAAREAERVSSVAAVAVLLLSIVISAWIVKSITASLRRLREGTRVVADGDFTYRIRAGRKDEFAEVARDFNTMTRRLGELDQMKRDFISKMSHDLKTPLASVRETVEVLIDEVPGPLTDKQRRLLRLNQQSATRLASMIAKHLDLSGLEASAVQPEFRRHDIGALVRRGVEPVTAVADGQRLRVTWCLSDEPCFVECDEERILQVLDNLLENAIKFSPEDGTIDISVECFPGRPPAVSPDRWQRLGPWDRDAQVALISVADEGPGVADEQKERIFDHFYQTEAGRKVDNRGVGLGLTICREIAGVHGGAIWVDDNPGGGSIFRLLLPRASIQRLAAVADVAHR